MNNWNADPKALAEHGYTMGFETKSCIDCKAEFPFQGVTAIRCFDCAIKKYNEVNSNKEVTP